MSIKTSLIIPTRNRAGILRLALPRMLDQTVPSAEFEIIVVDNASEDDTEAVVKAIDSPHIVYRRQEKRTAASGARNRAIALAKGELLLFVDDDALVRNDFIEQHLESHRTHPNVVVTGPIIDCTEPPVEANPEPGRWLGRHANPFPTCNASVRKDTVLEAGGFDEGFTTYGWEDPEMYRRLLARGVSRQYNWRAPIWHCKPGTYHRGFFQRLDLEESRGAMGAYYYAKHPTFGVAFETKQHALWRGLDRLVAPLLGLDARIAEARRTGVEPSSGLMQLLMINHTEIEAGRRMRAKLNRGDGAATP